MCSMEQVGKSIKNVKRNFSALPNFPIDQSQLSVHMVNHDVVRLNITVHDAL